MLGYNEIVNAIKDRDIVLHYTFIKENGSVNAIPEELNMDNVSSKSFSFFIANLYSDRLKLTLGPIIKSHQRRRFSNKEKFKHYDCLDLRKTNNKYKISPKESITVLTNEQIKLSGNFTALILPRVSLSEIGLSLTPAYIDPFYNGISRLLLTNNSSHDIELNLLDVIGQCYFFKLESVVPQSFKEQFSQKSVFYGHNWNRLLNEDVEPFPTRKNYVKSEFLNNFLVQAEKMKFFLKENSFISSLIVLLVTCLIGWSSFKNKYDDISESITDIKKYKKLSDSTINIVSKQENVFKNLKLHKSEIIIDINKSSGEKFISLPFSKENIITVFLNSQNSDNVKLTYSIRSGDSPNETKLYFFAQKDKNSTTIETISFEYSVLTVYDGR